MSKTVGIDLGTTYSSICYIDKYGKPEIIVNREGERIMPSVVLFDGKTPIVGTIAKNSAAMCPLNVCQYVKRHMGDKDWRFITDEYEYTAEEISALILKRLKEDAQVALGTEIRDAIITVPAYFNDAQRKATQDAGEIAGLNVVRIINEPTAAAIAYGIDQSNEQIIMVYDLGGGTFDVTIMKVSGGNIDVIATGGDKNLGGFNWDNRIMDYLEDKLKGVFNDDFLNDIVFNYDLREKAEIAKKTLSSRDSAKVFLSYKGVSKSIDISINEFEEITKDLLDRTESMMEMTLEDANLSWSDIDKILLVGGSTRMRAVQTLVEKISGKKPSMELHPDEAVSLGAALLGNIIEDGNELSQIKISDVNSHSLGIVCLDMERRERYNSIILPRNTKVLTKMSNVYSTISDNQTELEIEVTEGEEEDLDYVFTVGKVLVKIDPYPKGAPVEVTYEYDNNGVIHVSVYDLTAKKNLGEHYIQRQANLTDTVKRNMKKTMDEIEVQ
jgi:molecular chaperone DnaK